MQVDVSECGHNKRTNLEVRGRGFGAPPKSQKLSTSLSESRVSNIYGQNTSPVVRFYMQQAKF